MPTTPITTDDELEVFLGTLGDSPQQVAETLRGKGIKGDRAMSEHCPIANWLTAETGCVEVQVDSGSCGVYLRLGGHESFLATPPAAVDEFIRQFDDYVYPDLIAEG